MKRREREENTKKVITMHDEYDPRELDWKVYKEVF